VNGTDPQRRRVLSECLAVARSLRFDPLLRGDARGLVETAAEAFACAADWYGEGAIPPATIVRREFVKSLGARFEPEILGVLERAGASMRAERDAFRDAVLSCGAPDPEKAPVPDWFDPSTWSPPIGQRPSRDEALLVLAFATYVLRLHEEEILSSRLGMARFRDLAEAAAREVSAPPVLAWEEIARRLGVPPERIRGEARRSDPGSADPAADS